MGSRWSKVNGESRTYEIVILDYSRAAVSGRRQVWVVHVFSSLKLGTMRGESCLFKKDVDLEVGGGSHLVMMLANDFAFLNTHT